MHASYGVSIVQGMQISWNSLNWKPLGLPIFASKKSLYFETGWETLSCRRGRRKLTLFHKIHNNIAPEYLNDCLNEYLVDNNYNLRSSLQYRVL